MGYRGGLQAELDLAEGDTVDTDIYLVPAPLELDPIQVSAERIRSELELRGFYRRREIGHGFFLTPEQLKARPPVTEAELVARAPFVELNRMWNGTQIQMRYRGRPCTPILFVDDIEVRGGNLEDFVNFADIIGLEVYRGFGEVPMELAIIDNSCGVVMIWTVFSEQRRKRAGR